MQEVRPFRHLPRHAFTLIELLIVIAIIAVLVSIATPQYKKVREDSQRRACYENQRKILGALEQFNLDQNRSVTEINEGFLQQLVQQKYLLTEPIDPTTGKSSVYQITGASGDQTSITCTVHGNVNSGADKTPAQ